MLLLFVMEPIGSERETVLSLSTLTVVYPKWESPFVSLVAFFLLSFVFYYLDAIQQGLEMVQYGDVAN